MKYYLLISFIFTTLLGNIHRIIKYFTSKVTPRQIEAEMLIQNMQKRKIRPLKVEQAYNTVRFNFNQALKNKELDRTRILAIKKYLMEHTDKWEYKDKKFNNDCHCIYHLMKSKKLKVRDFQIIDIMIGVI